MGGFGSGWVGPRKCTVEESMVLSISDLSHRGCFVIGQYTQFSMSWSREGEFNPCGRVWVQANFTDADNPHVLLEYTANGAPVESCISLTTSCPHYGGVRWWFRCPVTGKRAAKLYRPPGRKYFAHRSVHDLTYQSCQQSGQLEGLLNLLGKSLGVQNA